MKALSGVFANLDSAERACRQLEARGIAQSQLCLTFDEHCPACAYEEERLSRGPSGSMAVGQGLGMILGIIIGIVAVFWPIDGQVPTDPMQLSLFDWMLRLFIIASWSVSGAILGGMFAAVAMEAWDSLIRRDAGKPMHSHYILTVAPPTPRVSEIEEVIQRRGGRLVEPPAIVSSRG